MTEKDIAESLTSERVVDGVESAERIVFEAYDEEYADWNSESGDVGVVNELELALVSLRVVKELIERGDISNELLQLMALQTPCDDATVEEIEATVEEIEDVLWEKSDEDLSESAWGPSV